MLTVDQLTQPFLPDFRIEHVSLGGAIVHDTLSGAKVFTGTNITLVEAVAILRRERLELSGRMKMQTISYPCPLCRQPVEIEYTAELQKAAQQNLGFSAIGGPPHQHCIANQPKPSLGQSYNSF